MHDVLTILTDVHSVCQSVCLSRGLNQRRRMQCTPRAVCAGHWMQPLSSYSDHLFSLENVKFLLVKRWHEKPYRLLSRRDSC